ncbi:hypothetical protein BH708_16215 [Brachybacterium sp. P6-10-X1]|nr:hypothetical protein BH708_16215 [Brachybacterium sp. P6-10-X1]
MAPSRDGGVEAKISTSSGDLAIQCKAFASFAAEVLSVMESFSSFLASPEHAAVTTYVWCSTAHRTSGAGRGTKRTTGNDSKSAKALQEMSDLAAAENRDVDVMVLFAEDIDRIIREHRPEYFRVMAALSPIRLEDISKYSLARAGEILSRLGDDDVPQLQYPTHETAEVLDRTAAASALPHHVDVSGLKEALHEVDSRARAVTLPGPHQPRHSDGAERIREIGARLTLENSVPAGALAPELHSLEDAAESAADTAISFLRETLSAPRDNSPDRFELDILKDRVRRYVRSLIILLERVEPLIATADAAVSGGLLISGQWGTGKSYQLAQFTVRALAAGTPVLLLRARDFTLSDAPILAQPWRGSFENERAESSEIAAMLDHISHRAGRPLHLVIDGLNEAALRDLPSALERLREVLSRNPNILLIISSRRDMMPPGDTPLPEWEHSSPDRVTISRSVERALGAPPGTRWRTALSNPLLAAVAVRVLAARGEDSSHAVGTTALLDAWVNVLADEGAQALDLTERAIRSVIDAVAEARGTTAVTDLAASTHLAADQVDAVVHRLGGEGLLECDPVTGSVRFRFEALHDIHRARHAIRRGEIDAHVSAQDEDRREWLLGVIAELLPTEDPPRELPDVPPREVAREAIDIAYALSLSARDDSRFTARTEKHAERLLRQGSEASKLIVWSVLSAPRRRTLGIAWLAELLGRLDLPQRSTFWPQTLENLCDGTQDSQQRMEDLLSWYAIEGWPASSPGDARTSMELLAWMGCAGVRSELPAFAISSLTELLHSHSEQLRPAVDTLRSVDDDHPLDALLTAAAGVVGRWPHSRAAEIVREVCTGMLEDADRPASYRALAALHSATGSECPMHEFLAKMLPPTPPIRRFQRRTLIPEDDRAMFADGRSPSDAERFEAGILRSLGVSWKFRSTSFRDDAEDPVAEHVLSLVRGRWLARQYADHPTGARLFSFQEGVIKAGSPENPAGERLIDPSDAWDVYPDPTAPLSTMLWNSDEVRPETWWAVGVPHETDPQPEVLVVDPEGTEWFVVDGMFRHLAPSRTDPPTMPTLRLGRQRWMMREDDGRPLPGRTRHEVVHVEKARLTPPLDPTGDATPRHERPRTLYAQCFSVLSSEGELVPTLHDVDPAPLSADLLQLLGARWTGWRLDCVDAQDELVITDPATGRDAPHAVLVHADALRRALERTGRQLRVSLTTTDLHSGHHRGPTDRTTDVTIR